MIPILQLRKLRLWITQRQNWMSNHRAWAVNVMPVLPTHRQRAGTQALVWTQVRLLCGKRRARRVTWPWRRHWPGFLHLLCGVEVGEEKKWCLLGASMGDPTHGKGHMEEPWWAKEGQDLRDSPTPPMTRSCGRGRSRLKRSPRSARASTPETKICLLYYTLLTLTGAIPNHLSLEN